MFKIADRPCDGCGVVMTQGEMNGDENGLFHRQCQPRMTFRQMVDSIDVELTPIGRSASASAALAIRREQGDMD